MNMNYLPIIFVVDVSRSMEGERMTSLNGWFHSFLSHCQHISECRDIMVQLAILSYSSGCKWMYNELIDWPLFEYKELSAFGLSDLGGALKTLNEKMRSFDEGGFFHISSKRYSTTTIIFISDGNPTDNYVYYLNKIKQNYFFKSANKIAIAIGNNAPIDVLEELTCKKEAILDVHSADMLFKPSMYLDTFRDDMPYYPEVE